MTRAPSAADRGGPSANSPPRGWAAIARRTFAAAGEDHASLIAAGTAFYALLALFPALAALVGIWSLLFDPQRIAGQIERASRLLPDQAAQILSGQMQALAQGAGGGLGLAAAAGILLAVWSATKGIKALIEGLNIVDGTRDERGFVKQNLLAVGFTAGAVALVILALGVIGMTGPALHALGLGGGLATLLGVLRWLVLLAVIVGALAVLYRYGPDRPGPPWRVVAIGAVAAALLWLIASLAFSVYVRNFGSYNETYGALGGVVVLLLWLWISALVTLLGAEMNAVLDPRRRERR